MMTFTSTSITRFDRLVADLCTDAACLEAETTRIAATLIVGGISPVCDRCGTALPDARFGALVEGIVAAQQRPARQSSRVIVTLFAFGILPARVLRPTREDVRPAR